MRYALLINESPTGYADLDEAGRAAVTADYLQLMADPQVLDGDRLEPGETATTVRLTDGQVMLTDGPFADTKEILGGFILVEAPDLDAALALARRIPALRHGGVVEVRPVRERPAARR
ncbi:hypothetical protein BJF78_15490 [Pseudonocardia sp. CNS-139]|nr:hypothetical protein BJF78_15490 [Pseudonocardia sp. CNS-139]